jgi:hypothetical protein
VRQQQQIAGLVPPRQVGCSCTVHWLYMWFEDGLQGATQALVHANVGSGGLSCLQAVVV